MVGFLLVLYVVVTLIDQLRQLLWTKVFSPLVVRLEEYVVKDKAMRLCTLIICIFAL